MRTSVGLLVLLQLASSAVGCKQGVKADCDSARELWAADMKQNAEAALVHAAPEQRAALQASADQEIARARGRFHDLCEALPADGQACMARAGEVLAAQRQQRQGAEVDPELARCEQVLEPFVDKLFAP